MTGKAGDLPTAIVCEDEAITSARLAQQLEGMGYEVLARPMDGEAAVQAAVELRPDLILMDIRMPPGIDGLEATQQIRQEYDATVVVITAHVNDEFLENAAAAGVEGYLVKPVSIDQLRVAVGVAMESTRRLRAARQDADRTRRQLEDRKTIERAKGILMDTQRLSEREAYRRIQKQSQDERRPMAELASDIIKAHELLSGGGSEGRAGGTDS
jgi:response regulator NasT